MATTPTQGLAGLQPKPILWKVSDADSEIWMLGSFHVLPRGTNWRTPQVDAILSKVPVVYFESTQGVDDPEKWLQYTGDRRVIDLSYKLKPESWKQLIEFAGEYDIPVGDFFYMQPWYAGYVIGSVINRDMGMQRRFGVDDTIRREAKRSGKEIRGLESLEDQLRAISAASEEEDIAELEEILANTDKARASSMGLSTGSPAMTMR
ncbi:MAG: TraB/GumN family protein [Geminicoccaceae bacterium]